MGRLLGALIVSFRGFAVFTVGKKLKVTPRFIRFLFGNRSYVTDFSMLDK